MTSMRYVTKDFFKYFKLKRHYRIKRFSSNCSENPEGPDLPNNSEIEVSPTEPYI